MRPALLELLLFFGVICPVTFGLAFLNARRVERQGGLDEEVASTFWLTLWGAAALGGLICGMVETILSAPPAR